MKLRLPILAAGVIALAGLGCQTEDGDAALAVPTAEEAEAKAEQTITKENADQELEKLADEIEKDLSDD